MRAVILAAGVGSRLAAQTGGKPKCLVEIGGRPLLLHVLEALADHGVGPVLCVLGHQADEVRRVVGDRAQFILNERYKETNSLYSLWLARDRISGPTLLLNSDLFFDPRILDQLLDARGSALVYDSTSSRGREQTKVALRDGRVVDIGKDLPPASARGESLGLLKFDDEGSKAMLAAADHLVTAGHDNAWVIEATRTVCRQVPISGVNVAGLPWAEIDFPYDLDVARREVWPAIYKRRWRGLALKKRARLTVVASVLVVVWIAGWLASSRLGPASIDWDSVPLAGESMVRIDRPDSEQRWWSVGSARHLTAQIEGPEAMIETRLVLPDSAPARIRYVVEIVVDGVPRDWVAFTATPDSASLLDGVVLGDRDRVRLQLADGPHQIGVRLAEGHSDRMLVRVRLPHEREE